MVVTSGLHADATSVNLHVFSYVQDSDPGAIGAGRGWVDTSGGTGAWLLKVRNDDDDDWEILTVTGSAIDHGTLSGLGDDDHPQYILKSLADAAGDLLVASGADAFAKLTKGSDGQVLTVDPTTHLLVWATPVAGITDHGALGGLGDDDHPQYILKTIIDASQDLIVGSGADAYTRLAKGSDDDVLTVVAGVLTWAPPAVGSIPGLSELTDYDADGNEIINAGDPTTAQSLVTRSYLQTQIEGITPGAPQGTYKVSGGGVTWIEDYDYHVTAGTGVINGVEVSWGSQDITLDAADPSDDRIDVIGIDDTGTVFKVTGDPASNPSEPDVDTATQLKLSLVIVTAGSTAPTGATTELVYDENVGSGSGEWDWTTSGSGINLASTNNPFSGTKDIEGTTVPTNSYAQGEIGTGPIAPGDFDQIVLRIRFKSAWNAGRYLQLTLREQGVLRGNGQRISGGNFGLDSSNITTYQTVVISPLQFAISPNLAVDQVRLTALGSGGSAIGFYVDGIQFIAGAVTQTSGGLDQAQSDARYQERDEKDVAGGYASTDGTNKVPIARLVSGTPDGTKFFRDDRTLAVPAGTGIQPTIVDAAGDLIVGTADNTVGRLAKGADDTVLTIDPVTHLPVWTTAGASGIPASTVDAKGDLLAGTADNTVARLAAGANDTILMADSAQTAGLKYVGSQTPSTQAFGDAAAEGSADTYSRGDHKHAMPSNPIKTVRVASTVTRALSTEVENGDTIDGVTLATGDRVLLKDQSTAADCGIYTVNASGAPTRATDFDASGEIVGAVIVVQEGTANADTIWLCTTNATITVGSTSLAFVKIYPATAGSLALDDLSDVVITGLTSGQVVKYNGSNWVNDTVTSGGGGALSDYILIEDQKTSGTTGGTFTTGAWRTRDLNTEVADTGNYASVSSNQISLAAGTYRGRIWALAFEVGRHSLRLRNVTDSTTLLNGSSSYDHTNEQGFSLIEGRFTIAATKTIEVQHQSELTRSSLGFGVASGTIFTVDHEVYCRVELWKE